LPDGRDRTVRHGHGPRRAIQTAVAPVEVRRAKVRDQGDVGAEGKIRFTSSILPKWVSGLTTRVSLRAKNSPDDGRAGMWFQYRRHIGTATTRIEPVP
jgi:hypothetical protein